MPRQLPYPKDGDWSFQDLEAYHQEIARVAAYYGLDTYPNQIEVVDAAQMLEACASSGAMPINYRHWSFGKSYLRDHAAYQKGHMGLAYEVVVNANPCIAYLMEDNNLMMQALVMAHACYGHNSFFKGNYLFKEYTHADSIIEYLRYAKEYVEMCEERYGYGRVERILDAAHSLQHFSVDRYKRKRSLTEAQEMERLRAKIRDREEHFSPLWGSHDEAEERARNEALARKSRDGYLAEPEENLLYFIEKNAPKLQKWEREIIRIVRMIGRYFYPQMQTQVMNEGWACFWHYHILYHLHREGLLGAGFMMEFLASHTSVVFQLDHKDKRYRGINPYALGFEMFMDIKRVCESPTDEDRTWAPWLAGKNWQEMLPEAMRNYRDESFIRQYLSPSLMRKWRMFAVTSGRSDDFYAVDYIANDAGYDGIREKLADQYLHSNRMPDIQVVRADMNGDRKLLLRYTSKAGSALERKSLQKTLAYCKHLWGYPVEIERLDNETGEIKKIM
ncbi:SpoVR family protein [Candidatus Kaiserbacteria bacterium RIFCSPHIGHO2_02_FULL_50_50]|uniref:SpoVR family protein n=1 Tax=Candidatus Kaiserbacteria bacterium RIFCSPHIGHO2_02_FULL_50_50 TaxID=1798492 RepID=A0A1F6DC28_9BACT|nr:MAG: SpoVR family protein [Candidatus Kaiserbacteria bacterium RIFCSPHIGHO2_02_FULL_50_50]